jgi:hypothetical protein
MWATEDALQRLIAATPAPRRQQTARLETLKVSLKTVYNKIKDYGPRDRHGRDLILTDEVGSFFVGAGGAAVDGASGARPPFLTSSLKPAQDFMRTSLS